MVTGASSGIGEQFARQLVALGYRVVVSARRADRLQKLCAQLGGDEHAVAVGADLAVAEDRDRLAARIDELDAEVDILVKNAGLGIYTKFGAEGRDKELQMLRVDVEAVVDLMARYLPGMVERGRGAIINLSSVSGFQPGPYNAGYAAAKAYVLWSVNASPAPSRAPTHDSGPPDRYSFGVEHFHLLLQAGLSRRTPFAPPPLQELPTTTSRSASRTRNGTHTHAAHGLLPLARSQTRTGSVASGLLPFHAEAADRARVASMPDTTWPVSGHPPGSSRDP